jgi:prolyl-tRNA synthetase
MASKLTSRESDYSKWYNELVVQADLAQHSDVKGCMVIKPYGFAIWERMKDVLDQKFKDTGTRECVLPFVHSQELPCRRKRLTWKGLPRSALW